MKKKLTALTVAIVCISFNISIAQQIQNEQTDLKGPIELSIDVSNMTDTAGKFMVMVGEQMFFPEIKDNLLTVHALMKEPRITHLSFYPEQKIKANPGKPLNLISAGRPDHIDFLGIPGKHEIVVKNVIADSKIINTSVQQEKYDVLRKMKQDFYLTFNKEYSTLVTKINSEKDKLIRDSLISAYYKYIQMEYRKYYQDSILGFVKQNSDAIASLFELDEYCYNKNMNLKTLSFLYNNLTDRLKKSPGGKRVYNVIDQKSFTSHNLLGKQAIDFTQNTTEGVAVSLKDFKGHVTLLEFWASWCGPCRVSNPGLVRTFKKYNTKGFKILGISLDNKSENWLKAIKDDGLLWTQVSDLKEFENSVAVLYHVKSVPSNFLVDQTGKIIASNLEEKELNEYLERLLK